MTKQEQKFVDAVWEYYRRHGRRSLPWRHTQNPYRILVSEIMLQQTQVERVIPKYQSFLKRFPTFTRLSKASLGEVLTEWQGLGYNRRAKMLHECARQVVREYKRKLPDMHRALVKLPGIGTYTAGAILAFAYNKPIPVIETNIRSAIIHHFFHDDTDITDAECIRYIEHTLDTNNPREWYYALMDYGASIKKEFGNPNQQSKHYTHQSAFKGSDRQIRGTILKLLTKKGYTRANFLRELLFEDVRIDAQLEKLLKEELITKRGQKYCLPNT